MGSTFIKQNFHYWILNRLKVNLENSNYLSKQKPTPTATFRLRHQRFALILQDDACFCRQREIHYYP